MVTIIQTTPRTNNGEIDRDAWFNRLSIRYPKEKLSTLSAWFSLATPHGLEVANILLELHADLDAILAALLIEYRKDIDIPILDTLPMHLKKILKNLNDLDELETKLTHQKEALRLEAIRQMMLAMIKDVRVVLVQLAKQTYQARQMKMLSPLRQQELAHEIMALYTPLANRLGIGVLKWELEDRAFAVLEPQAYHEITDILKSRRIEREHFIQNFLENLTTLLDEAVISGEVTGRVKHIYSIFKKMQNKKLKFEDLYDVRAVRVLVRDVPTCYTVMALLHSHFKPLTSEYTDYILNPKPNGYRSLHTVLQAEDGLPVEVQIRSFGMHEQAESGIAAHWRYKEDQTHASSEERIKWLRTLLDWQHEISPDATTLALDDEPIYVFTKDNEVFALKKGATPIDFAFLIHTKLGLRTKGAIVNGRMMSLTHILETGDQVEILSHKEPQPSRDWLISSLGFIQTTQAKRKLRAYFRSLEEPKTIAPITETTSATPAPIKRKVSNMTAGTAKVGLSGIQNLPYELAGCCNPEVGNAIIASITRLRGVVIHKQTCPNVAYFKTKRPERLCEANWLI